jgi:hypothetical protein
MKNNKRKKSAYCLVLAGVISVCSCSFFDRNEYSELVKKELAKEKRVDSLFLGIHFGMTSKQFYGYCWELNKKGVLTDGNNNTAVLYKIDKELKYPASMNFYPDFFENKIYSMRTAC